MRKIDYSQYSTFLFCPWLWYEKYVRGMSRRYTGQRDDNLALGSLVHAMMDNLKKLGCPVLDEATIAEVNPTPEAVTLAETLVRGYLMRYPREKWGEEEWAEAPLEFPLDPVGYMPWGDWTGIAKLDRYFYLSEDTTIESGLPGQSITLGSGWWSREFKTKAHGIRRDVWIKEWMTKRQADFQLLALQHHVAESTGNDYPGAVRGVLVSVLEKPREYEPKRKCKGCGGTYELQSYRVTPEGFSCPICGEVQKLNAYNPKVPSNPDYFRIVVTRTPDQLAVAREEIAAVAERMDEYMDSEMSSEIPNRDHCISNKFHRECEFAEEHTGGVEVGEPKFVKIDPYRYIGLQ